MEIDLTKKEVAHVVEILEERIGDFFYDALIRVIHERVEDEDQNDWYVSDKSIKEIKNELSFILSQE